MIEITRIQQRLQNVTSVSKLQEIVASILLADALLLVLLERLRWPSDTNLQKVEAVIILEE